ncbi:hypothetical protein PR048_027895 [Dryococelus australis]|uniref:Uncharacterized protein n=1 Tax=Dryococelus australis TaxID=614101 RepID=A0ABQ9GHU9_9NEOP|nr:hypothetical protein PR048_027895 [Dryococelus australis]
MRVIEVWSSAGMKGRGNREIPDKTRRPVASSGTIPVRENPVTLPGIEPGSSWWEASRLTAQPPLPQCHNIGRSSEFEGATSAVWVLSKLFAAAAVAGESRVSTGREYVLRRALASKLRIVNITRFYCLHGNIRQSTALRWKAKAARSSVDTRRPRDLRRVVYRPRSRLLRQAAEQGFRSSPLLGHHESGCRAALYAACAFRILGKARAFCVRDDLRRAAVVERLASSPPTEANRVQSPAGSLRIFASGNRSGRCRWSACFLGELPFPPPVHSGSAPFLPRFALIGSQDLAVKEPPKSPH